MRLRATGKDRDRTGRAPRPASRDSALPLYLSARQTPNRPPTEADESPRTAPRTRRSAPGNTPHRDRPARAPRAASHRPLRPAAEASADAPRNTRARLATAPHRAIGEVPAPARRGAALPERPSGREEGSRTSATDSAIRNRTAGQTASGAALPR